MKSFLNSFKYLGVAICASVALVAHAQVPVQPAVYPVTNTTTFTFASAGTNIAAGAQTTINSQPFPIWRGRGFAFQSSCLSTSSTSGTFNITNIFQFAIVKTNITGVVTNWCDYGKLFIVMPVTGQGAAGTTYFKMLTNVPASVVDNYTLGRLQWFGSADTNVVRVDPTNTFIGVIP